MLKSTHREVKIENMTLRDALREANHELRNHRKVLGGLATGHEETLKQMERLLRK